MRTIAVNALRLMGNRTAMGRHLEALARHWSNSPIPFDKVIFFAPQKVELPTLGTVTEVELCCSKEPVPNLLWEQLVLCARASFASVLFCPAYTAPITYPGKLVVANHGIYERTKGEFTFSQRLRSTPVNFLSVRRADHVIANSNSTKKDLIELFGVKESHLSVILPAANELCFLTYEKADIDAAVKHTMGDVTPYVIFVGKLSKRRNVPNLIKAFSDLKKQRNLPHKLLIIGPNTSDLPLDWLIEEAGGQDVVVYRQFADMDLLCKLYAGADLYVLPTTYEGISQTMFEAMASGTAVLSVDHPTLAEGGGDAVMSVPTPSVEDLSRGMECLLLDGKLRADFQRRGRERAALFSWSSTAARTMEILDRTAKLSDNKLALSRS